CASSKANLDDEPSGQETVESVEDDILHHAPSRYDIRREMEEEEWSRLVHRLSDGFASFFISDGVCSVCHDVRGNFRCEKCNLLQVCEKCLSNVHSHNPPHVVRKWNGSCFETVTSPVRIARRNACDCSAVHSRRVLGVTEEGEDIVLLVEVCECSDLHSTLLAHGFWITQPLIDSVREIIAVHIGLLLLLDSVSSRCTASLSSLCNALQNSRSSLWLGSRTRIDLFRVLNTSGCFRAFRRLLQDVRWGQKASCPACFVARSDSDSASAGSAPTFLMLDACFGLRHRKQAGKAVIPAASGFFVDVDVTQNQEPNVSHCPNFTAGRGQGLVSASDRQKLDVFGLFCGSCRHSGVTYLADVVTPGERLVYSSAMVNKAIEDSLPDQKIIVSYDIACKLSGRFNDSNVAFAIPAFHAYGHKESCQLKFGIRSVAGAGLTDGESCERIWSTARRFGPQLKEMTHTNRRDFLNYWADSINFGRINNISVWLFSREKVAKQSLQRFYSEVSEFRSKISIDGDLSAFLAICSVWEKELLEQYSAADAASHSRKDPAEDAFFQLQQISCDRRFLIEHAVTESGQKMNKALNKTLRKLNKKGEALVRKFHERFPTRVIHQPSLLNDGGLGSPSTDRSRKRQAVKLLHLYLRIEEEASLVRVEVRRASNFFATALLRTRSETSLLPNEINLLNDDNDSSTDDDEEDDEAVDNFE
uniref:CxC2 domain-containing protein n=1 Tax=Macrostomum lignano TaxID=282301 RepID=A0A1I8GP41_9PLAT